MIVIDYRQLLDKIDNPPYTLYSAGDRAAWLDECITTAHAFDAEPVKHGRWLDNGIVYTCSECNCSVPKNIFITGCDFESCPYCFARMDGDRDKNVRNLTDEEAAVYESQIESEAKDTGVNIMEGDSE